MVCQFEYPQGCFHNLFIHMGMFDQISPIGRMTLIVKTFEIDLES